MRTPPEALPIGMQIKQQAATLATLLWARKTQGADLEYAAYEVIGEYMENWEDGRKADLYARLAEKLSADDTFPDMVKTIAKCLFKNVEQTLRG